MTALTSLQAAGIRTALTHRQQVLRDEIRAALVVSGTDEHQQLAGVVRDAGDESVANLLHDVTLQSVHRDVQELRALEAALERFAQGQFGTCTDCGGPIGARRLEALSTATRCIACEERHDKTHAHAATPKL
ncbi:MAG: TraR/DksA family transcriptional regulator [Burkholderiales bacterium]